MKKCLTVLLVIAVMFTFSFGSAFAATATGSEKADVLKQAKAVAEKIVNDYYDDAMEIVVKDNLDYTIADDNAIAAAWEKIDVRADVLAKINELYVAESELISDSVADNDNYEDGDTANMYAAKVFKLDANDNSDYKAVLSPTDENGTASSVLAEEQLANFIRNLDGLQAVLNMFNADRDEALSAFDKVNWDLYSTKVNEDDPDGRTYLQMAEDKIADAKEGTTDASPLFNLSLSDLDWTSPTPLAVQLGSVVQAYVNRYVEPETITVDGKPYETGLYKVIDIPTKDDVDADDAVDEATIAAQKAAAASAYAQFIKDNGNTHKDLADAWLEVVNYLAEEGMLSSTPTYASLSERLQNGTATNIPLTDTTYEAAVEEIAELEAFATKYKAERDATGALVRDAEEVDKIVAEYTAYLYGKTYGVSVADYDTYKNSAEAMKAIINSTINSDAQELAFAKEQYKTALADALDDLKVSENYYDLEAATIQTNYETGIADIDAATTVAKVKTAYDKASAKLNKNVKTKTQVDALCTYGSSSPEQTAYEAVQAYVEYVNTGKTILNEDYIIWNANDAKDEIEKIYGEAGARTSAERKAVTIDAATVAATLSTVGGLDAAKTAAENAINALPSTITVSDQDAVVNAWTLAKEYEEMTGAGSLSATLTAKLNSAQSALLSALKLDFAKQISAVDKTDREALKSLQADIDAVNKLFEEDAIFEGQTKIDVNKTIAEAIKSVRADELKAVIAQINALPVNITEDDKAQVIAAREAYDAFVEEWTDYREPYNAAAKVTNFRTLALAEATLGLNDNTEENIKAYLQDLSIVARSVKTASGNIKVTINADVQPILDAGYTVEYKFYRSTKPRSNYGTARMIKTENVYTNTTGTKGVRYYYKAMIQVKDADGNIVATTPLSQCKYACRVK